MMMVSTKVWVTFVTFFIALFPYCAYSEESVAPTPAILATKSKAQPVGRLEEDDEESSWAWTWSSEEEGECDDVKQFWHIRGLRCVPYICPKGNSQRNFDTGECLYDVNGELIIFENSVPSSLLHEKDEEKEIKALRHVPPPDFPQRWWTDMPRGLAKINEGRIKKWGDKMNLFGNRNRALDKDAAAAAEAWSRKINMIIMKRQQQQQQLLSQQKVLSKQV